MWEEEEPYTTENMGEKTHLLVSCTDRLVHWSTHAIPDSKVYGVNMGPTWVLSAPDGPHVGPTNLAIRDDIVDQTYNYSIRGNLLKWFESYLCFSSNTDHEFCCHKYWPFISLLFWQHEFTIYLLYQHRLFVCIQWDYQCSRKHSAQILFVWSPSPLGLVYDPFSRGYPTATMTHTIYTIEFKALQLIVPAAFGAVD